MVVSQLLETVAAAARVAATILVLSVFGVAIAIVIPAVWASRVIPVTALPTE